MPRNFCTKTLLNSRFLIGPPIGKKLDIKVNLMHAKKFENNGIFFHTYISMYTLFNTPDNSLSKISTIFYLWSNSDGNENKLEKNEGAH